ncbi:exodeoxyribonuclease I [Sulfuriferula nivalis]|uniref:Exodeoxyribonuclease I n=1 Tax=Sulfuriferula nivalis TaxID=2675298 RepID=A0A809RSB7_9PROT|nr:exodeoxyribonuclease I [Sulfuriferula nivalis]BBP01771.1 exodeoxyribonuclease I [Sulfuriferula nivalis]
MHTFLWHDYETFGVNTRSDRPAQFAAIRTDADLNEIGEPVMCYCQPTPDYLPDPQSCLITGITPQTCMTQGINEAAFAAQIETELSQPNTIGVGYNTIRFDDEVTRFMFWRNLIDPYAREWQNGCGRWDILDVVRAAYALRPDGINWPTGADGRVSFRLELLTAANNISHTAAHDALSDVRATIALARLIRTKQPKLFDFCFKLHKKDAVAEQISLHAPRPFVHISGMIPVEQGCIMVAYPLATHPTNKNEIIVWDCAYDPSELATLDVATLRTRMFSKTDALPAGVTRLPIKTIHINKSPVVSPLKTLSAEQAQHWGLDMDNVMANVAACQQLGDMNTTWREVYQREYADTLDVDEDLYNGFISNDDRRLLTRLRGLAPEALAQSRPSFTDARLDELLFRYRARNYPATLNTEESGRWHGHCADRLFNGKHGARTLTQFSETIDQLAETADDRGEVILSDLYDYADSITPDYPD